MTSLSHLSSAVLGLIVDSSRSFYVYLRLYLCGNRSLNSKLSSGVTRIKLVGKGPLAISEFPRSVLSLCALRRLTIESTSPVVDDPLEWRNIINSLPPTLERLKLSFAGVEMFLLDGTPRSADDYSCFLHPKGPSLLVCLGLRFPHLHTLKLYDSFAPLRLQPKDYLSLPSNLTCLGLDHIEYEEPFLSLLPRSLTHLDVDLDLTQVDRTKLAQDWSLAPPNLQTVTSMSFEHNDPSFLPSSLTQTNLYIIGPPLSLPRNLRTLCIQLKSNRASRLEAYMVEQLGALPSTLVKLSLARECTGMELPLCPTDS